MRSLFLWRLGWEVVWITQRLMTPDGIRSCAGVVAGPGRRGLMAHVDCPSESTHTLIGCLGVPSLNSLSFQANLSRHERRTVSCRGRRELNFGFQTVSLSVSASIRVDSTSENVALRPDATCCARLQNIGAFGSPEAEFHSGGALRRTKAASIRGS